MSRNNLSSNSLPVNLATSGSSRYPEKLVWGASMIWEESDTPVVSTVSVEKVSNSRSAARPFGLRLTHALLGTFFGLGR